MTLTFAPNNITAQAKPKCRGCSRVLDNRIPRAKMIKFLFPFLSLKRYKCTNCLRTTYRIKI